MSDYKKKALLVEDDRIQAKMAKMILKQIGFDVDHTTTGEEAVEMSKNNKYDLGIFDIGLDGMLSGDEAAKEIRQLGADGDYAIFAVTAHVSKDAVDRYIAAGMNEVFQKPIVKQKIIDAYEKLKP